MTDTTATIERRAIRMKEASRYSGFTRPKIYDLIRTGKVRSFKIDGVRLVDFASLKALLDNAE